jgi:hypothetical protein
MAKNKPQKTGRKKRQTASSQPSAKKAVKHAKKASVALRSSVALAHATTLFADLHERIKNFVLDELGGYGFPLDVNVPIPGPVFKDSELEILLDDLRKAFVNDLSWGTDPDKFKLTAKQLINLTNGKNLSYFIQVVYQRAHDALRS